MRKYIFPIIKKQKEEEEEKKDKRIPLYKRDAFDIEPYKKRKDPSAPTNTNEEYVDYNIDDQENVVNNNFRL